MSEYEIIEELKMLIRCSDFAQNLSCDGVSVDFLKSTLDFILKQKSEIERNKSAGNSAENHGHWIKDKGHDGFSATCIVSKKCICSECGWGVFCEDGVVDWGFCPNCGSIMDKEEDVNDKKIYCSRALGTS